MKKLFHTFICSFLLFSCGESQNEGSSGPMPESDGEFLQYIQCIEGCGNSQNQNKFPINTYMIDGCEYVGMICRDWSILTHKGNCKNPVHLYAHPDSMALDTVPVEEPQPKIDY